MARRRTIKTTSTDEEVVVTKKNELEPAWPSSPTRPPKYVLYIFLDNKFNSALNAVAKYAAKKLLDALLDGFDYELIGDHRIETTDGHMLIRCEQGAKMLMEYKYTAAEKEWELPKPYPNVINQIRTGRYRRDDDPMVDAAQLPKEKKERVKKEVKERTPRVSREGLVSIGDICTELGIDPRDARKVLRAKKMEKPDAGWAWATKEAAEVKAMIKKELKK